MSEFWALYLIFSVTTAVVATIYLVIPVLFSDKILRHRPVYHSRRLALITMFLFAVVTAPLLIIPVLSKEQGEKFKNVLLNNLNEP